MLFAKCVAAAVLVTPSIWCQFRPQISVVPKNIAVDSGEVRLTILGNDFTPASRVMWNGQERETQLIDSRTLKALITESDTAEPSLVKITVSEPASDEVVLLKYLALQNYDLIYDPLRARVYVSVSRKDPNGPSIAVIEPEHGAVDRFIPTAGEPGMLALSDDSRFLYVGLDSYVRRIDLTGATADVDLHSETPNLFARGILPLPGGRSVVVLWGTPGQHIELDIYDDGRRRGEPLNTIGTVDCLCGAPDASTVYVNGRFGLSRLVLDGAGVRSPLATPVSGLLPGRSCPVFSRGLLYGSGGDVVDPAKPARLTRFGGMGTASPAPEFNRTYFISTTLGANSSIQVFANDTRELIQLIAIPAGVDVGARLIHWGERGVGFSEVPDRTFTPSPAVHLFKLPTKP